VPELDVDMAMTRKKKIAILIALFVGLMGLLLLVTGEHDGSGRFRVGFAPFLRFDLAPKSTWIVQSGVNIAGDRGIGAAGNFVEFPVFPGYRVGIRYFSKRWWREEHAK